MRRHGVGIVQVNMLSTTGMLFTVGKSTLLVLFLVFGPQLTLSSIGRSPLLQPVARAWNLASLLTYVPELQNLRAFQDYQDIFHTINASAKNGRMDSVNVFLGKIESNVFFGLRAWEFFRLLHADMEPVFNSGEFKNLTTPKRKRQRDPGELWSEFDESMAAIQEHLIFSAVKVLEMQAVYRFGPSDIRKGRIFGHPMDCPMWQPREYHHIAMVAASAAAGKYANWMQEVMDKATPKIRLNNHHYAPAVEWAFHSAQLAKELGLDSHDYEETLKFTVKNHDMEWTDTKVHQTDMNRMPKVHFFFSEKISKTAFKGLKQFLEEHSVYGNQAKDDAGGLFSNACLASLETEVPVTASRLGGTKEFCCTLEYRKPYFMLVPLKKEILHDEPELTVYHGAFPPSRCKKVMKTLGTAKKAMRSTIRREIYASRRISTTAHQYEFVYNGTNLITKHLDSFVSALADLDLAESEGWQFQNYESGEFYGQHTDPGSEVGDVNSWKTFGGSSRIATLLVYLNDVELGGATAYPKIGVHAAAKQGNVLVMYNHDVDGKISSLMTHGGCPVIFGTKTIAVKWIHGPSQFLKRPCPAKEQSGAVKLEPQMETKKQ